MSVLEISRVDRVTETYDLAALFPKLAGPFTVASVALLPLRTGPNAATVWTTVTVASGVATILFAGPDADSTGAVVATGNADVWIKTTVGTQTDAAKAGTVRVAGGGAVATPLPLPQVLSVQGRTGAVVLSATDVGAPTTSDLSTGLATKVNSSTYTAGLAAKQDVSTLGATVAADATVRAAYVPRRQVPRVAFLGHSMPTQAGGLYSNIDTGSRYYPDDSYIVYGQALSGGRWLHDGTQAQSGATIQDALNTHLPALLARADRPDYCVVHLGQNDIQTLSSQDFTDLAAIYAQLRAAGIAPVAVTEVASVTAPGATWKLNQWITRHAREQGIPLVDFYAATVDPATGTYLAGYSGDGIHPTGPGAYTCGQALANVLTGILPATSMTAMLARTDLAAVSNTLLVGVPTFQTDDGGTPPVSSPWQVRPSGSTFGTQAGIPGRIWTLTMTGGADASTFAPFTPTVTAGDRLLIGFQFRAQVQGVSGHWQVEVQQTDNGGPHFHIGGTRDVPWSTFAFEFTVPAGIPNLRIQPRADGVNGAQLGLAQLTIMNLTTQGIA